MTDETKADFAPDPARCPECGSTKPPRTTKEEDGWYVWCQECGYGNGPSPRRP